MCTQGRLLLFGCLLLGALLLAGCSKRGEAQAKAGPAAKPAVAVETSVAAVADFVEGVEVTGSLEPKFSADVKTQIPGLVKASW